MKICFKNVDKTKLSLNYNSLQKKKNHKIVVKFEKYVFENPSEDRKDTTIKFINKTITYYIFKHTRVSIFIL